MNQAQWLKEIRAALRNGESKEDIYLKFKEKFGNENRLARILADFPTEETRLKYKGLNLLLFWLLIVSALLKIVTSLELLDSLGLWGFLLLLIIPLINLSFAAAVWNMQGWAYRSLGWLVLYGIFKLCASGVFVDHGLFGVIYLSFFLAIAALSFYIGLKAFPYYGWLWHQVGPDGKVIFK